MSKSIPKSVKWYPPVWEALKDKKNKNFIANYGVGSQLGIPDNILLAYARGENELESDKEDANG